MDRLDLNIITRFKLNKLDSVDHVRRRNNSYSVNEEGKLVALSLSESYLQKLIIGEEGFHLEHLYLAGNQELTHVEFTGSFPNLVHLYLNNCKLNRIIIPAGLSSLRQAYFQNNQLIELTFEGDCPELQFLDLSKNQMQRFSLPSGFSRLAYLYLSDNRLKEVIFDTLSGLEILHLKGNQLDELPTNFLALSKLETLYLSGNPLSNIPTDVIGSGDMHNSASTVLAYLKSIRGKITQYLHEAKLILIGNPEVGKSSIRIKLQDPTADLPTQDERTPGLIVERYFLNQIND